MFTGTVLNTLYGLDLKDPYDPYVEIGENAMSGFSVAGFPGKFLVDIIPACKCIHPVYSLETLIVFPNL